MAQQSLNAAKVAIKDARQAFGQFQQNMLELAVTDQPHVDGNERW
ncbi:hypothetical protein RCN48_19180 [Escherichia marmotae]|nr:hypothetical protein [Escherichia marmotae]